MRALPGHGRPEQRGRSSGRVLVLNASFEPINVCTVRRAAVLILKNRAEMLEHGDWALHAESVTPAAPGRDSPPHLRAHPARRPPPQDHSPSGLRPRPLDLPVLRPRTRQPHRGPRDPALEGRLVDVGQHRHLLRALQPAQGRPAPEPGEHGPGPQAAGARAPRSSSTWPRRRSQPRGSSTWWPPDGALAPRRARAAAARSCRPGIPHRRRCRHHLRRRPEGRLRPRPPIAPQASSTAGPRQFGEPAAAPSRPRACGGRAGARSELHGAPAGSGRPAAAAPLAAAPATPRPAPLDGASRRSAQRPFGPAERPPDDPDRAATRAELRSLRRWLVVAAVWAVAATVIAVLAFLTANDNDAKRIANTSIQSRTASAGWPRGQAAPNAAGEAIRRQAARSRPCGRQLQQARERWPAGRTSSSASVGAAAEDDPRAPRRSVEAAANSRAPAPTPRRPSAVASPGSTRGAPQGAPRRLLDWIGDESAAGGTTPGHAADDVPVGLR